MRKTGPASAYEGTGQSRATRLLLARIHPGWWVPIGAVLGAADYLTGHLAVPPVFAPIAAAAAWYSGVRTGVLVAVCLPVLRLLSAEQLDGLTPARFVLGVLTLVLLAVLSGRLASHERALQERIAALESLLPMCMFCKSIRNSAAQWQRLEAYMEASGRDVTHGICPSCADEHYPNTESSAGAGVETA